MRRIADIELLRRYCRNGSEEAFSELAARHGQMVYATCLRVLGRHSEAADAAQAVFMLLTRKADSLLKRKTLGDWLYWSAVNVSRVHRRSLARRSRAEKEASMIRASSEEGRPSAGDLRPELDAALESLPARNRTALVMAYLQGRPHREVAAELGIPLATLRSRLSTGIQKLRSRFATRGVTLSAATVASLLMAESRIALPAGLSAALNATGAAGPSIGTAGASILEGIMKNMLLAKTKLAVAAVATAVLAGGGLLAAHRLLSTEALAAQPAGSIPAGAKKVLDEGSFWRWHVTRKPVSLAFKAGGKSRRLKAFGVDSAETPPPLAGWEKPDFDDTDWPRSSLTEFYLKEWSNHRVCFRGKFVVQNPSSAGDLFLNMNFRGGCLVYLNGREVARPGMLTGKITPETVSKAYPQEAWADARNKPLANKKSMPVRERKFGPVKLPASALRKGVNILAVDMRRPPFHPVALKWKKGDMWKAYRWCPVFISRLTLGSTGSGVIPNRRPAGIQVWTADRNDRIMHEDYGDPAEGIRPLRIFAARNGSFCGQVAIGSPQAFGGVKIVASQLKSKDGATIPASAVSFLYGLFNCGKVEPWSDGTREEPPAKVEVVKYWRNHRMNPSAAILPITARFQIPEDARRGDYKGALSVSAGGRNFKVPVELSVADWRVPNQENYRTYIDIYQSPTTVALQYKVQMWSEKHWKLMDRSWALLGRAGNRLINVSASARTQLGEEHSMITWIKKPGGGFDYDFKVFDRYLKMAVKHCKRIDHVALHLFFVGGWGGAPSKQENKVSVHDPKTGKLEYLQVPVFGTEESKKFWKPYLAAVYARLAKIQPGLEKSMCLGILNDGTGAPAVFKAFDEIWPGKGPSKWMRGCHVPTRQPRPYRLNGGGQVVLHEFCYGGGVPNPVLHEAHNSPGVIYFRFGYGHGPRQPLYSCRTFPIYSVARGSRGLGRVCLDFWPVNKQKKVHEKQGDSMQDIYNRFPESTCRQRRPVITKLAYPGPNGATPTVRLEAIIEGTAETEAAVLLSEATAKHSAQLGADLTARAKKALADYLAQKNKAWSQTRGGGLRVAFHVDHYGWQEVNRRLFACAAKVSKKVTINGKKTH